MTDQRPDLTFLVWADTHFGYEQRFVCDDLRWRIIDQMNHLPGSFRGRLSIFPRRPAQG